jgi:hypothetical protein
MLMAMMDFGSYANPSGNRLCNQVGIGWEMAGKSQFRNSIPKIKFFEKSPLCTPN